MWSPAAFLNIYSSFSLSIPSPPIPAQKHPPKRWWAEESRYKGNEKETNRTIHLPPSNLPPPKPSPLPVDQKALSTTKQLSPIGAQLLQDHARLARLRCVEAEHDAFP